ncbi:ranBP-type and C3HC4-type zinc finger-containing protein 1 isoform X2 [Mobula hypostoma]|uniref:ranBP-type and C3HC4-type zinc finger-containing protein 1 isoform X2 n=1 Tax=Mobula hypostoma TaxID=723540 RepID=UPI002FC280A6
MASSDVRGVGAAAVLMERPAPAPAQQATVLMSCRVSEGGGGQNSALRLQLSMERPGEFRLGVRHGGGRSLSLYEFNLKDIIYEFKSMTCHGISTRSQPTDQLIYHFEDEEEAQRWSTIINSSLREVEKAISTAGQQNHSPSLQTVAKGSPRFGEDPPRASADVPKPGIDLAQTEDLSLRLARAIEAGDCALSSECAVILARQKACLGVSLKDVCYPSQQISLRVGVEDATSSATILVKIFPYATIFTLKQQVFQDFGFHPSVQRWIIGQCLAADHRTLSSYGVKRDGDPAFLYLLSAKMAGLPRHQYEEDQAFAVMSNGEPLTDLFRRESLPASERRGCNTLPSRLPTVKGGAALMHREGRMDASNNAQCLNLELLSHQPLVSQEARSQPLQQPSPMLRSVQKGWACTQCTFINKPTRPGCEMCSNPRPQDYVVPDEYALSDKEFCRMLQEEALLRSQQELEEERLRNYEYLLQLDGQHLVTNPEPLECPICLSSIAPQDGVVLRDCLHSFCRDCLKQLIRTCADPQVPCPYRDSSYACDSKLQEREIRALVSVETYNKFLDRSMSVAESSSDNSYHCRTADCKGWCIYEDAVNQFHCPSCGKLNCLLCKAIHEGMNCKQYQDDLAIRAVNDAAARHTKEMLKTLVQSGEAMRCPQCRIIVQKKGGCDWIRCPVCHTEICWVTKKCRWGPGGPGDTSGGCRCLVNGQKCHPLCQNCH